MNKKLIFIIILILTSIAFLIYPIVSTCIYILSHTRNEVVHYIVHQFGKPHLLPYVNEFFSPVKYKIIKVIALALCFIITAIYIVIYFNRKIIVSKLTHIIDRVSKIGVGFLYSTLNLQRSIKYLFIGLLLTGSGISLYSIINIPISYDEADTWLLFISQGPIFISSFYPFPNNHIFYNWCVWIISTIPISPSILLRFPIIPAFIITYFVFFRYARILFNEKTALVSTIFFVFSYPVLEYNHLGRGYMFVLMFSVIILYALHKIGSGTRKRYRYALLISLVLGTYTVPSFIYFSTPALVFYLLLFFRRNRYAFKVLFKICCTAGIIIGILYMPVLFLSGNHNFLLHYTTIPTSELTEKAVEFHQGLFSFIFGYSSLNIVIGLLFAVSIIAIFLDKRKRWFIILTIVIISTPYIFFILQRQIFPQRIFIHIIIFSSIIIGSIFQNILNKRLLIGVLLIFTPLYIKHNLTLTHSLIEYNNMYDAVKRVSEKIMKENKKVIFFKLAHPAKPIIEYYTIINNYRVTLLNENGKWKKHPFNWSDNYDVIVWATGDPAMKQWASKHDIFYAGESITITTRKVE